MTKKTVRYINMFFGNNNETRFKRIMILLITVGIFLFLFFNISYSKKNGLEWSPAGKVNVELKK